MNDCAVFCGTKSRRELKYLRIWFVLPVNVRRKQKLKWVVANKWHNNEGMPNVEIFGWRDWGYEIRIIGDFDVFQKLNKIDQLSTQRTKRKMDCNETLGSYIGWYFILATWLCGVKEHEHSMEIKGTINIVKAIASWTWIQRSRWIFINGKRKLLGHSISKYLPKKTIYTNCKL